MSIIFWIITSLTIIFLIRKIVVNKDYLSLNSFVILGVYFPMILSEFDWSSLHILDKPFIYYAIFLSFDMLLIIVNLLFQKPLSLEYKKILAVKRRLPIEIYNIAYAIFIFIENYYASGFLMPAIHGIDVHTARAPYIYWITTGIFFFSIMNFYEYLATKKKKYLIYILLLLSLNVVTKSARIDTFICVVQLGSFLLAYYLQYLRNTKTDDTKKKLSNKSKIALSLLVILLIVIFGLKIGNNRMNFNGKYNMSYADGIKYNGPFKNSDLLAHYYGYFPLSFDNLAYNIEKTKVDPNYIGLSSFRALYFGVLQFDNIFNLNGGGATRANNVRSKAAAVSTAFWDFYYDYKELFIIPLVITFLLYCFIKSRIDKNKNSILYYTIYFYWIPLWMFMSFDNRIFDYQVLLHIIMLILIIPRRYSMIDYRYSKAKKNQTKKIALLGFEFESSNKGCEALSYSFMEMLNTKFNSNTSKKINIVCINIHTSLGKIPKRYPNFKYINVPVKLKKIGSLKKAYKEIKSSDIVFDITHGDSFSDIYGKKWYFQTCLLKFFVIINRKKLILLPQTYGPYKSKLSLFMAKFILNKSHKIYSRDVMSTSFLNELGIRNDKIFTTTDIAFSLPYEKINAKDKKIKVGINVSGLLYDDSVNKKNNFNLKTNYYDYCCNLIEKLYSDGYEIHLIPHVICDNREGINYFENDTYACKKLKEKYPFCIYNDNFDTAIDVKSYISRLDVLVAARMHASIAAFSSGCVSIPFAYSRKVNGLYKELKYDFFIDGIKLQTSDAVNHTIKYIHDYKKIKESQLKGMKNVSNLLKEFTLDLDSTINDIENEVLYESNN